MPWTPEEFKAKHWKGASAKQARAASKQAGAMIESGVDEGVAIATAIKQASHAGLQSKIDKQKGRTK